MGTRIHGYAGALALWSRLLRQDDALPAGQDSDADCGREVKGAGDKQYLEPPLFLGREVVREVVWRDVQGFQGVAAKRSGRHGARSIAPAQKDPDDNEAERGQNDDGPRREPWRHQPAASPLSVVVKAFQHDFSDIDHCTASVVQDTSQAGPRCFAGLQRAAAAATTVLRCRMFVVRERSAAGALALPAA
jgi:hypothetical protein